MTAIIAAVIAAGIIPITTRLAVTAITAIAAVTPAAAIVATSIIIALIPGTVTAIAAA
ncbi:hypothetical protein GCM10025785_26050 [Corynebacterium canis]